MARLEELQAAAAGCSRQWRVTADLMVHIELDMFAAVQGLVTVPGHSERRGASRYLRVTLFARGGDRRDFATLTSAELAATAVQLGVVDDWVSGKLQALPASSKSFE